MALMKVAVLMGGESAEREISLLSGANALKAMDRSRYEPIGTMINEKGLWSFMSPGALDPNSTALEGFISPGRAVDMLQMLKVDIVFIALHGPYGEDGTVQGMLELHHIPYTGSRVAASALAMDKDLTRSVLGRAGLPIARGITISRQPWQSQSEKNLMAQSIIKEIPGPWFVKPVNLGSSVGIGRADDFASLVAAVNRALEFSSEVLIEQFVAGTELTCAVLGNWDGKLQALPPVEILPKKDAFFTYEEKYNEQEGATEVCPPKSLNAEQIKQIQSFAEAAHLALRCDGMSRVDMIFGQKGPVILEVNTIPGLTQRSLLPKAAAAAGIEFPQLVDRLIQLGLERFGKTV